MEKIFELPHSRDSEMMVLGCMLNNQDAFNKAVPVLETDHFFSLQHQMIYNAMKSIHKDRKPGDIHILADELKRRKEFDAVGGVGVLMELATYAGTSAYVEEYIEILKEKCVARRLIHGVQEIQKQILEGELTPYEAIDGVASRIEEIRKFNRNTGSFQIQFLNERESNFLLDEPAKKPMILEWRNPNEDVMGFLPKSIVGMVVGAGGVGKTHFLAQLTISIASGQPFLGKFIPTKWCGKGNRGHVFLGLGENSYSDIHRVLYKAARSLREKQPDLMEEDLLIEASKRIAPFSFSGSQAAFIEKGKSSRYFRELKMRLEEKSPDEGWALIILDPVSRFLGADAEIDNAAATQFIALLEELSLDLPGNPTILFAHHVNKTALNQGAQQNQSAARGSSALTDGVRWQVHLTTPSDKDKNDLQYGGDVILSMKKTNFTAYIQDQRLQRDDDGGLSVPTMISLAKKAKRCEIANDSQI